VHIASVTKLQASPLGGSHPLGKFRVLILGKVIYGIFTLYTA